MAGELSVDPTKSPWVTVKAHGRTKTRCRYCLQFFTVGNSYHDNHFKWCEWLAAYLEG